MKLRFRNARREPLNDRVDVQVRDTQSNTLVASKNDLKGTQTLALDLAEGRTYSVRAFPGRHRPVGRIVPLPIGQTADVELFFPIHPDRVEDVKFPGYEALPATLATVLERSTIEGAPAPGRTFYDGMGDPERAGLLNLYSKMVQVGFAPDLSVWHLVQSVYRIRPDRIFADVDVSLRDRVKSLVLDGRFREVSGTLHSPPPGFKPAGSYKTDDRFGNLQLTFFASEAAPLAFKVDADIDDAAGVRHAFQVLRNWVSDGTTHPFDIHQILVFRQDVVVPYELA